MSESFNEGKEVHGQSRNNGRQRKNFKNRTEVQKEGRIKERTLRRGQRCMTNVEEQERALKKGTEVCSLGRKNRILRKSTAGVEGRKNEIEL